MHNFAFIAALIFFAIAAFGERLTFQGAETWDTWRAPVGLTQIGEEGQLQLTKFSRNINAVADAQDLETPGDPPVVPERRRHDREFDTHPLAYGDGCQGVFDVVLSGNWNLECLASHLESG